MTFSEFEGHPFSLSNNLREDNYPGRALIFGVNNRSEELIKFLSSSSNFWLPIAFLDDNPNLKGTYVGGIPILGDREYLISAVIKTQAKALILTDPNYIHLQNIIYTALGYGLNVKMVPPAQINSYQIFTDPSNALCPNLNTLLGKKNINIDLTNDIGYLHNKKILVTGAGGSIGRELCAQIYALKPQTLLMLDSDESALHQTSLLLGMNGTLNRSEFILANIRDSQRINQIFESENPQIVFHTAALKHIQSLERNPGEAIQTNIWGTLNILSAAACNKVERFINISTDKAANPASVLGYTKRISEALTAWYGNRSKGIYASVRFGNVFGSRGSVLDTFLSQISKGDPLTVTHPEATRYFMSLDEAVKLVIYAANLGESGKTLVLDMGEPIRIIDIATYLKNLYEADVEIRITGLEVGEKMHEELYADSEIDFQSRYSPISQVQVPSLDPDKCIELNPWAPSAIVRQNIIDLSLSSGIINKSVNK